MKLKRMRAVLFLLVLTTTAFGQQQFVLQGKVEYERKVNMHALMGDGFWGSEMRNKLPQFRTSYFDLVFDSSRSVYKAGREVDDKYKNFWGSSGAEDVKYTHYATGQTIQSKEVFENKYLLQDSILPVEWRITPETRTIAGFECRKAVGKFMDSLYVIAFFTDEVVAASGPESFTGLPGLILGLAFPRIHTTWFATKVELRQVTPAELAAPAKGKKITRAEILKTVKAAVKDWGKEAQQLWIDAVI